MTVITRYPPCEQWLAAVGAGAGSFSLFRGVGGSLVVTWQENGGRGLLTLPLSRCTGPWYLPEVVPASNEPIHPPCEQWLAAVVAGAVGRR
jgi:hypothetical protein